MPANVSETAMRPHGVNVGASVAELAHVAV
jgi:hypothetical protein